MSSVNEAAVAPAVAHSAWQAPASLYLHVPFCPYKCAYCDFVTHVGSPLLVEPYVEALCMEIESIPSGGRALQTVYFGGGTPSMLSASQLYRILATVERSHGVERAAEISLEVNPDAVDLTSQQGFLASGINRLSIGVQSFDAVELRALGRGHSPEEARRAVRDARVTGFDNVSLDLIYGSPQQSIASWQRTLSRAIELEPDHLSLYSLIVEPATRFWRQQQQGRLLLPPDDDVADMYYLACAVLRDAGYDHYEVANWARPGKQARHNRVYWLDEQFFAAGVGAFDYLRPYRSHRLRSTKRYIDRIREGKSVIAGRDAVNPVDEQFETAVMRLRLLNEGLDGRLFERRFGQSLNAVYGPVIAELIELGFLERDCATVRLREHMVPLANEAWQRFLPQAAAA